MTSIQNAWLGVLFFVGSAWSAQATIIDASLVQEIEECLGSGNAHTVCEYPKGWRKYGDREALELTHSIRWNTPARLQLVSKWDVIFADGVQIRSEGSGAVYVKAGMENAYNRDYHHDAGGAIEFGETPDYPIMVNGSSVRLYYNPQKAPEGNWGDQNKYWNRRDQKYSQRIKEHSDWRKDHVAYMLVNHVRDLQDIEDALYANYALSQNIDATETQDWDHGKGFRPLRVVDKFGKQPFSGFFDGNGYIVSGLMINRPEEEDVGLFGSVSGSTIKRAQFSDLTIVNATVAGDHYVGGLIGEGHRADIQRVSVINSTITARGVTGGLLGTGSYVNIVLVNLYGNLIHSNQSAGIVLGTLYEGNVSVTAPSTRMTLGFQMVADEVLLETPYGSFHRVEDFCVTGMCFHMMKFEKMLQLALQKRMSYRETL
ncbi:MAG: hypothetical protein BGO28_06410 [Alphaproteobacteria bacterium 43-37]|nr:MAG: hypothetical protein BGO28_06410 [Alphaproteobacteria bacterium 43-37]